MVGRSIAKNLLKFTIIIIVYLVTSQPGNAYVALQGVTAYEELVTDQDTSNDQNVFLPVVLFKNGLNTLQSTRRINAPFFDDDYMGDEQFSQMAIAWFGQLNSKMNYSDIRVGYNDKDLYVRLEIFDRFLWYKKNPEIKDLEDWDAATLYLDLDGNNQTKTGRNSYRFVAQLNWWEAREGYQAAYRGTGDAWELVNTPFFTYSGYRGNAPNDDIDDRGWGVTFRIPFTDVLGLTGRPPSGTIWGMGIALHDRDDVIGSPIEIQTWPKNVSKDSPVTWGQLHFGMPLFSSPPVEPKGSITIRHKLDGIFVQDAAVGGTTTNLCPGDPYFIWNAWGEMNFAGAPDFNIQNQGDVADWPCFAKYYLTFPLEKIPLGIEIISAKVTLYQFGNSGDLNDPDPVNWPQPSLIQVLSVTEDWDEMEITWNNAPMASENIGQAWVSPLDSYPGHPGIAREWDVSYAAEKAYSNGQPLRLVLYESDIARHSGKYFIASDVGDWNEIGRPTLTVAWGD